MSLIKIIPLNFSRLDELEGIRQIIESRFKTDCLIKPYQVDLSQFFDPVRSQYNANQIIEQLNPLVNENCKIIGVTDLDIYIPVLSYIFGQAYLGGSTALVSGYRLDNRKYGLEDDPRLFHDRLLKCMLHELGHAFGLKHCLQPGCLMVSATYVEDMDQKGDLFCIDCQQALRGQ